MTTRDRLVRAVIADPDADAPREAFATWGVDNGDPQAELARIQLAEAHERRAGSELDARRLNAQAFDLIAQHRNMWARKVLEIALQPQFFRGFVEVVVIDVPTFLARASELYDVAPIRSIQFLDAGPHIDALAESPHLARLVAIDFNNRSDAAALGNAGLRTLVASPHLGKLAILHLAFNNIGLEGVEALACSKQLPGLRYATLGNNPVDDPTEDFGIDGVSGEINSNSISLPPFGRALEAKFGKLRWLHGVSQFRMFPPNEHDV